MKIGLGLEQIRARKRTDWTAVPSISGVAEQSVTSDHHTSLNDHPSESGDLRSGQNASVLLRHRRLMYKRPGGFTSGSTKLLNTIRRRKHLLLRGRTSGNLSTQSVGHHHRRTVRTVSDYFPKRLFKGTKLSGTKKCLSKHSIEKQICAQNVELVGTAVPVSVEVSEEPETVPVETSDQSASAEESVSSEVRGGEEEEKKQEAIKRETLLGELKKDLKEYCSVRWTFRLVLSMLQERLEELERSVDETNDGTDVDQSNSQDSGAEAINQPASSSAAPASFADATITDNGDLDVTSNQKETEEEHVKREAPESPPSPGEALDGLQSRSSPVATVDSEAAVAQQKKKSGYTPLKTSKSEILDPTYTCEIKLEPLEERKASFVDSLLDKFNLPPPTMPLTNGLGGDGGDDGTGEQSQQSRRCLRDRTKIAARPRYIEIPEEPRRVRVSKVFGKLHKSLNLDLDSTNSNSSTEFYGFDEGEVVKLDKPSLPGLLPTPIVKKSQPYAPFLAYGTCISDKEEDSRGASPSSTATIRSDLLRENGLLSYGSHPPRLQCPLRPSDMIRPRTVAQKRILLEHLNDVRYPMIDNESKIYRFLMMKTKNQDEQLDFERMKELQDQQIPFTRGTWRALSWLRTEKDRNNLQAVCIDGRWTNLTGCRGNHSNKLLIRKKMYSGVVQSSAGRRIHYINNCHCPAQFPPGVSIDLSLIEPPKKPAILCASKKEEVDDDERKLSIGRPKLLPDRSKEYQHYRSFPDTKPGPLSSKRLPPSAFEQDPYLGPLEIFEMPTVELEVFPKIDRPLDGLVKPYLKMILPYSGITENWARFAVSTLRSTRSGDVLPGEDGERSFIFQVPYANDERRLLIRRRLITRPGEATVLRTSGRGGFGATDLEQFEHQLEQRLTFREAIDRALEKGDPATATPVDEDEQICADVLSELTNSVAITIAEELFATDDPDLDYREEEPEQKPLLSEQKKDSATTVGDDKKAASNSKGTQPPNKAATDSAPTGNAAPECSKPAAKSKLLREMKRLNATIIESPSQPTLGGTGGRDSSVTDPSAKSVHRPCDPLYCAKGCICDVLGWSMSAQATISESRTSHCQRIDCVLGCVCGYEQKQVNHTHEVKMKSNSAGGGLISERSSLTSADVKYLREKATARLAKEEREFTPTVILTDNATVLVRNTESETRRQKKKPKKYDDYYNENSMQKLLSGRFGFEDYVPATPPHLPSEEMALQVKPLPLADRMRHAHVLLYNLSALTVLEPWCMVHQLYRCYCGGTATQGKPFSFLEENCVDQTSWESSPSTTTSTTNSPCSSGNNNNNNNTLSSSRMGKMMITNGSSVLLPEPKKAADNGNAALPYLAPFPRKRLYSFEKITSEAARPGRPGRPPHTSTCSSGGSSARKRDSSEESYKPPNERRVKRKQKANQTTNTTAPSCPSAANGVELESGPRRKGIMRRRFSTGDWVRPRQLRKLMEEQQHAADAQYKIVARPAPKAGISNIVLKRIPHKESPPKLTASPPKRLTNGTTNHRDDNELERTPLKTSPTVSQTAQIVLSDSSEDEHLPVVDGRRKQKFTSTKTHVVRPSAVPTNGSNSVMTEATSVTNSTVASSTDTTTSKSAATNSTTNITNSNSTNSVTTELAPTLVVTQRQLRELIEREKVNPSPVRAGQRRLQNVHLVDPTNGYDVLCTPTMRLVICGKKKAFVDVRMLRRPGVLDSLVSHSNAMVYIVKIPINTTNTIPSATLGDVTMTPGCTVPPVTNATQGPPTMMPPTTVRRILDRRHSVAHVRTPSAPFQQQQQQQFHSSAFRAPHARRHEVDDDRDENSVEGIAPPDQDQLFSLMRHVSTLLSRDTPCLSQVKAGILHICRWTALVTAFAIGQADIIDVTYQNGNKQTLIWINRRPNTPLLLRNYKSYTSARQLWRRYGQRAMQKDHATLQASLLYRMIISGIDNPLSNRHLGLVLYGGLHYWLFCGFIKTPKDQKSLPLAEMKAALPIRELSAFGLLKSFSDKGSYSSADVHYRRPLEESQIDPEINPVRRSVPSSTTGGMPAIRVIPTSSLLEKSTPTGSSNPSDTKQSTTGSAKSIGRPSNIHIAPACPSTDSTDRQDRSRHCRWIKLYIVDDFTDMYIPSWRYCIQHSQLMKAIQHANRHRAVRCLEFTLSPNNRSTKRSRILPRIYAAPYQDNSIYVGPFPITQTQTDIMLCVASDGLLYTREEHERRHGIAVDSGAKRTKGLWIEMAPEAMELLQRQLDRTRVKRNAEGVPRAKASTCFISPATTVTLNSKPPTIIDTPAGTVNPVRLEPKGVTDRNATTAASAIAATDQRSLLKRNQPPVPSGIATSKPAVPGAVAEGKPTITRTPLHANVRRIAIPSTDLDRFTVGPKKSRGDDDDDNDDDDDDEIEKDGDDYEKRKESDIDAQFSSSCARSVPFSAKKAEACADPVNDFVAEPAKKDDTDRLAQLLEQTMQYTEQEQRKVEHLIKSSRPIPEDKVSVATEISATPTTTAALAKGGEQDRTIVVPITMNRKRKSVDVINGDSAGGDGEGKQQQQQQQPRPVVPVQAKFIRIADSTRITTKELRGPISIVSAAPTAGPAKTITFSLQKNGLSRMSIGSATPAGPIATPAVVRLQRNALSRVSLPLPSEPSTSGAACSVQAVAKSTTQPQTPPTTTTQLGSKPGSGSEVQILRKIPMVRRNSVLTLHDIKQYTGKYKIIIPPKPTADGDPTAASKPNPNGITGKFRFKPTGSSPKKRKLPAEGTVTLPAASTAGGLEAKSVDAKLSDSLPTGTPVSSGQNQHQRVKKKGNSTAPTQRTVDPSSLSKPSTSKIVSETAKRNRKRTASNATSTATEDGAPGASSSSSAVKRTKPRVGDGMSNSIALSSIQPEMEASLLNKSHKEGILVSNVPNLGIVEVIRLQIVGQFILRLPEITSQKRSVIVPSLESAANVLNEFIQLNTYAFLPSDLKIDWTFQEQTQPLSDSKKLRSIINQRCIITKYGIVDFSTKGKLEEFERAITPRDPDLVHQVLVLRLAMLCYPKTTYEKHKTSCSDEQIVTRATEIIATLTQSTKAKMQEKAFYKKLVEENKLKLAQLSKQNPNAVKQLNSELISVVVIDDEDDVNGDD
ncbi:uncharacterized protein LOC125953376 [Anopheles darlingi]|uniref:uncharacterized protein LOC125953376 n=1 Tax=Anopheles darlingi TaxID=43151 RepID=UPI0021002D90|nr:uncharacterized protein LOC125953376 [Anopheles darlingi]XP_049538843.1 uncharacterized protein LOC125953376 [Anopheles darlingi]XP_049538844.1 uncharacterized protein LOC125953376 [Anopheles darlingi]XP_049538845.1 uncharacterized protein LOC125953376 [Anopheles darlingi]XP_049538846.1 uncharacterized protein LOC125953376 [Anopheles darlingi]XP_049538847.1 uncharacterized protein LOC125953376 [Anopheles darlingi]